MKIDASSKGVKGAWNVADSGLKFPIDTALNQ